METGDLRSGADSGIRVLRLPMRDGNQEIKVITDELDRVLRLPMRDGNSPNRDHP